MSHQAEEFCCHSITRLYIELAMLIVHRHGIRILAFTEPRQIADFCLPTFTNLSGSLPNAISRQRQIFGSFIGQCDYRTKNTHPEATPDV